MVKLLSSGRIRWSLAAAVLLVSTSAHIGYWYWPREREATPAGDDVPARLLADQEFPEALWLAFPHQNLGALVRGTPKPEEWLQAAARLAGTTAPNWPHFGPFLAPPAREVCIAADPERHRFVAVARVYPVLSAIARLAGKLAGNPWMAGGEVSLSGRPARVEWQGTLWSVSTETSPLEHLERSSGLAPALAWIRLATGRGFVPPGSYRVFRRGAALEAEGGVAPDLAGIPNPSGEPPILLLASAGSAADGLSRGAFVLYGGRAGEALSLPHLAALREPGAKGWKLPGAAAADWLGGVRDRPIAGGLELTALDSRAAELAASLAPSLGPWLDPARPGAPSLAARIDLAATLGELHAMNAALAAIPILSRKEAERWRDAERLLAPFAPAGELAFWASAEPPGLRLRLGRN